VRTEKGTPRILPIFLVGSTPENLSRNRCKLDAQTDEILKRYDIGTGLKRLVRKEEDILNINSHDADGFVVFPYTLQRFAPLIYLAETNKPVTIVSEENTFHSALEAYDYLSDHENVQLAFSPEEVRARIQAMARPKWFGDITICLFDAGEWKLDGIAWQRNPLLSGKLNVKNIDMKRFIHACTNVDKARAERLAERWMKESEVLEPSLKDVTKCAQIYLAMRAAIRGLSAKAAYVLWCGQFTKPLQAKLCFALAKLADEGYPVGCWRGGNLLPMLILHAISKRPVFTPEALSHRGKTVALKHCFAPGEIGPCRYTLREWRTMKGTVTGYCQLPRGQVTLINCGIGDRMVVTKGRVVDCKDLGGENCRITMWVEIENEESIHKFVGREFAMVYGDYEKEAREMGEKLGVRVL